MLHKNLLFTILSVFLVGSLASCGVDRWKEYEPLTELDTWMYDLMQQHYLWYQAMPSYNEVNPFAEPASFLAEVKASNDAYSFVDTVEAVPAPIYGFDYSLVRSQQVDTAYNALVTYVIPNSPAEQAGLKRGDYIVQVNGENVNSNNTALLQNGGEVTLCVVPLARDEETGSMVWTEDTLELHLTSAAAMENNPFYLYKVIDHGGTKVGYLVYNEFETGPNNSDLSYMEQMLQIFYEFKLQGVTEFVLDLRYNQGGMVSCAQMLATLLAPANCLGQEFAHFVFNNKRQDLNYTLNLQPEYAVFNLNLNRLFIISGQYTASASEMIINGLRPYMTVNLLGTRTIGKNVAMTQIDSPYGFTIYPVTATVYNKNGESDYSGGFAPEYVISELNYYPWGELGDENELLLRNALQWMDGSIPADAENVTEDAPEETPPAEGETGEEENPETEEGEDM